MSFKNPYFSSLVYGVESGNSMFSNMKSEVINAFGYSIYYLPRLNNHVDFLFQESPISSYEVAVPIMMYPSLSQGYQGMGDILTKFSVRNDDSFSGTIHRADFLETVTPTMMEYFALKNINYSNRMNSCPVERPREGDLVYSMFDKGLFHIKYVNWRDPFYPNNQTDIFVLELERTEYSGERINILINPIPELQGILKSTTFYRFNGVFATGGVGGFNEGATVYIHPNQGNLTGAITAQLLEVDHTARTFSVTQLSDYNPDGFDANKEHVWNQYNSWYMSNADRSIQWRINTIQETDVPYQDNNQLQSAFDGMKIIDSDDVNPYGFI